MPYPSFGGGAGGGFRLGPVTNTFTSTTARDTYATNNANWLARYDANEFLLVRVGTGNGPYTYYQRSNDAWADVTPVLQGAPGEVASLSAVSRGNVPYKNLTDDTFADSGAQILTDGSMLLPAGLGVEAASIDFGDVTTVSEANSFLRIRNAQFPATDFDIIDARVRRTGASSRPRQFYLTGAESALVLQSDDTSDIIGTEVTFTDAVTETRQVNKIVARANAEMTNVRFRVSYNAAPNTVVKYWPSKADWLAGTGNTLTPAEGTNEVEIDFTDSPFRVINGDVYDTTIRADALNMKGNSSGAPYTRLIRQLGEFRDMAYESDIPNHAVLSLHSLGTDFATRVDVNDTLNGNHVFTYNVSNVENLSGDLTLEVAVNSGTPTDYTLTAPGSDGPQSETVNITNLGSVSSGDTITFKITATDTESNAVSSNTVTVNVVTKADAYWIVAQADDLTSTSTSIMTSAEVDQSGDTFRIGTSAPVNVPAGQSVLILMPTTHDAANIFDLAFSGSHDAKSQFTRTASVTTSDSVTGIQYRLENQSGESLTMHFEVRV